MRTRTQVRTSAHTHLFCPRPLPPSRKATTNILTRANVILSAHTSPLPSKTATIDAPAPVSTQTHKHTNTHLFCPRPPPSQGPAQIAIHGQHPQSGHHQPCRPGQGSPAVLVPGQAAQCHITWNCVQTCVCVCVRAHVPMCVCVCVREKKNLLCLFKCCTMLHDLYAVCVRLSLGFAPHLALHHHPHPLRPKRITQTSTPTHTQNVLSALCT